MQKTIYALFLLFLTTGLFSQNYTISGYIEEASSGEKLISANVFDIKSANGTISNTYGFYSITLPSDSVELTFSYIGYQAQTIKFYLDKDVTHLIKLDPILELKEIEIIGERIEKIEESSQMSRVDIPVEQIKKLPALLGEVDVLKTLQLLPGVQSGGEGQSGLYVRGGSPDQNLVLLDGVPVYNVSHLLGIFSVFNADAIKNVTLTKGGFPARFGGRLSSVLEINMKEGNLQEFHGEGSIGLISSKFSLEGPIKKGKTSFLLSGRRTYADLIFRPVINAFARSEGIKTKIKAHFYDVNAKVQHKFNDKHRLFLSVYSGADVFFNKFEEDEDVFEGGIDWGNTISALRWNYQISNKLFANTTVTYSNYDINFLAGTEFNDGQETEKFSAKYVSGIEDVGAKVDFDFIPLPNHYIRFGVGATNHTYRPGALTLKGSDGGSFELDTLIGSQNAYSMEYSAYVEDDIRFGALKANVGLHASAFNTDGKWYTSLQPRIGLRYLMSNNLAIKASYASMAQYINLLTFEGLSLPSDLWVPSTDKVKPQTSWQAAMGLARTFNKKYEISVEAFYKKMHNVVAYKEGSSFLFGFDNDWQEKVTQGDGEAYGMEVFLQKKKGRTTGWIGYTLSWNYRQFDELNGGNPYPYRYDRRHDVSVVVLHELTDNISISGAWIYGTGNAVTLNVFRYPTDVEGWTNGSTSMLYFSDIESGGKKNAFRMSDYHRLDLSIEFRKQKKRYERHWTIGVYNAYNNKNPYYMIASSDYDPVTEQSTRKFKEISILPIIPSFSYGIKF
jgi:hypothetical protein